MARLTIPDEATFAEFTVVTSTSAFPITFSLFAKADLTVYVDDVALTQSDFTFSGTVLDGGGYDGGTVTLNTAVDDVTVRIERDVAPARTSNFAPASSTPVGSVDQALNRITAILQDVFRKKITKPVGVLTGKFLSWDVDGTPITSTGTGADAGLRTDLVASTGAGLVGFINSGVGAVIRSLQAWLRDMPVSVKDFAATGDGSTDDTDAFDDAIAALSGRSLRFPPGTYVLSRELVLPNNTRIISDNAELDFSAVAVDTAFPNDACVFVDGGAYVALPDLSGNVSRGAVSIALATAPTLSADDLIAIYNPTDYSWIKSVNGNITPTGQFAAVNRASYRAGEMQVVESVSTTTVNLLGSLRASYTGTSVDLYKMPNSRLILDGGLRIKAPITVDYGFRMRRIRDSDISGLNVVGGRINALAVSECYNISGNDVRAVQRNNSGTGGDYGLAIESCEIVKLNGYFVGYRHGATSGTSPDLAGNLTLPCRDLYLNAAGGFMANGGSGVWAWGGHGNSENVHIGGLTAGGILVSGNQNTITATMTPTSVVHPLLQATELFGADLDCTRARIIGAGVDPTSNGLGLVDFGSTGGAPDADLCVSGTMNFDGMVVEAPSTTRPFKFYDNGIGSAEKIVLKLGLSLRRCLSTAVIDLDVTAGSGKILLDLTNYTEPSAGVGWAVDTTILVKGWTRTMFGSVATNTSVSVVNATRSTFEAPKAYPSCVANSETKAVGGINLVWNANLPDIDGATFSVGTYNGSNFLAAETNFFSITASLFEW